MTIVTNSPYSQKISTGFQAEQRGAVLIVSLLILLVMTLIGVTAMTTSNVEQKMSGNQSDLNVAFQSAEAALRDAEAYIQSIAAVSAFNGGTTGLYTTTATVDPFANATWSSSSSRGYSGTLTDAGTAPRYVIQLVKIGAPDPLMISNTGDGTGNSAVNTFRITARATGKTSNSYTYLQEHYGRAM